MHEQGDGRPRDGCPECRRKAEEIRALRSQLRDLALATGFDLEAAASRRDGVIRQLLTAPVGSRA